ncbi:MAG: hypothetical protein LBT53_08185 [Puniceicoccales bacterium]|jgi:hypothetical protein|nr:hypothetical protein [Puniceicoccales bacterium]
MKQRTLPLSASLAAAALATALALAPLNAAPPPPVPFAPSVAALSQPFNASADAAAFKDPPAVFRPETLLFFIGGNVSKTGVTADLEAIAAAGISGIQLFHGQMGGAWPGVAKQIPCLSAEWDDIVRHTATECRRLGIKFAMHNSPGWAMSGGPWIKAENAMRHLAWSRTDITAAAPVAKLPTPAGADYRDIAVLAFPTPEGDSGTWLQPAAVSSTLSFDWKSFISGKRPAKSRSASPSLPPAPDSRPHRIEITFAAPTVVRTVEFPSINGIDHGWCYEPAINVSLAAVLPDGKTRILMQTPLPQASWQDDRPVSLACDEAAVNAVAAAAAPVKYILTIANKRPIRLHSLRLYSAARKNNWESEAGWTLRSIVRNGENPRQSAAAFLRPDDILDITEHYDRTSGKLAWTPPAAPARKWTVLRVGHVNTGMRNGPAPREATGWECDKLSTTGADTHFAGYIGRLTDGPLAGGLLRGVHLDSWECKTQTWTPRMETEFAARTGYPLRRWLPAVFGYVVADPETSSRFLRDWRGVIGDLFATQFYGRMATLAKEKGLGVTFETSAGDIFPADIMEFQKYADAPQTEFWQPMDGGYVGDINFKPVKPTAAAARLYGKPRVGAEAFTSFKLTWDEHLSMLKEVANINCVEGVTHLLFHTYTHNPRTDLPPPGSSFGHASIGTPFLRGQTWWRHMREFTSYFARCGYLFERGKPVSSILWYLGDEINHKPNQNIAFAGHKYDYCNPDVLLNRLAVRDGKIVTPEGLEYRLLWLADSKRMLPETLEKIAALVSAGAVVVGDPPLAPATLAGGENTRRRYDDAVKAIWHSGNKNVRAGVSLETALTQLGVAPDVTGGDALWLHRKTDGADWYFVCAPKGKNFKGRLSFDNAGAVEIWDPVTGEIAAATNARRTAQNRTEIDFDLAQAGSCFVVFNKTKTAGVVGRTAATAAPVLLPLETTWELAFPHDHTNNAALAPALVVKLKKLVAWKDIAGLTPEQKAFSGTARYRADFQIPAAAKGRRLVLDLGQVEMIAKVTVNGKTRRTLWAPPYSLDITDALRLGENSLEIEVTSTWFNRLVYDAGQPAAKRKTWLLTGPRQGQPLRPSGLLGPVVLRAE